MAVARRDVAEIYTIIWKYIPAESIPKMFEELTHTKAYQNNASFRATVDRLLEEM